MAKELKIPFISTWLKKKAARTVHVVRLAGVIGAGSALRPGLSLASVNDVLERAFARKDVGAVAIVINSPGGSPVQSALIHDRIRQLADKNETPVLVFCEDVAASGGYWLALAGDEIYADKTSIVGSIGVIAMGFGFTGAIKKLGVERRVYTAGENKSFLDPFQKEQPDDVKRLKDIQLDVHDAFKAHVRNRRGGKLDETAPDLFTGAFWTGEKAREMGLIDGIGHMHRILADRLGDDVVLRPMNKPKGFLARKLMPASAMALNNLDVSKIGGGLAEDALDALEIRAMWQRYGL